MTVINSWNQLPPTLTAQDISSYLNISRAGAYQLLHSEGFPTIQIGKRLLVDRSKFLQWVDLQSKKATTE